MNSLRLSIQAAVLAVVSAVVLTACYIAPQIPCTDPNCLQCRGHGNYRCPDCFGRGRSQCNVCSGRGMSGFGNAAQTCFTCNGSGMKQCWRCSGNGMVNCTRPAPQPGYGAPGYPPVQGGGLQNSGGGYYPPTQRPVTRPPGAFGF